MSITQMQLPGAHVTQRSRWFVRPPQSAYVSRLSHRRTSRRQLICNSLCRDVGRRYIL